MQEQLNDSINRHSQAVERMMLESQAEHKKNAKTLNDMRRALYAEKHSQAQKAKEIRSDMMSSSRMSL